MGHPLMAGHRAVEWWRAWHGMVADPKWRLVAKTASVTHAGFVTPGHVLAIWAALCERASESRTRGSMKGFDADVLAMAYEWDRSLIDSVVSALREHQLIKGDRLAAWADRQPSTTDRTAKERKQRQRERQRAETAKKPDDIDPAPDDCHATSRRDVTARHGVTSNVTTEREIDRSLSRSTSSQDSSISTPNQNHVACASVGEVWQRLQHEGIPAGLVARTKSRTMIAGWIERGVTREQLDAAIERARQSRRDQNDPSPLNVGYLDKCLQANTTTRRGHGFEQGDAAVDRYIGNR